VLRRYEPEHLLLRAAWEDAKGKLTEVGRLARLLDRAQGTMVHMTLDRVSPMAVPVLVIVGREATATGLADDALLIEAESLAEMAMRVD
jgi:ATP-dependent Lhr-like helicase